MICPLFAKNQRDITGLNRLHFSRAACVMAIACVSHFLPSHASARTVLRPPAIVCLTVSVDIKVWPGATDDSGRGMTGFVAEELRRHLKTQGVDPKFPSGKNNGRNKIAHAMGLKQANPSCHPDVSTFVTLNYIPQDDGKPFVAIYEIHRNGRILQQSSETIKLDDMPPTLSITDRLTFFIYRDLEKRAGKIFEALEHTIDDPAWHVGP